MLTITTTQGSKIEPSYALFDMYKDDYTSRDRVVSFQEKIQCAISTTMDTIQGEHHPLILIKYLTF